MSSRWRLASVPGLSDWYQDRISCTRAVVRSGIVLSPNVGGSKVVDRPDAARNLETRAPERQGEKPAPVRPLPAGRRRPNLIVSPERKVPWLEVSASGLS